MTIRCFYKVYKNVLNLKFKTISIHFPRSRGCFSFFFENCFFSFIHICGCVSYTNRSTTILPTKTIATTATALNVRCRNKYDPGNMSWFPPFPFFNTLFILLFLSFSLYSSFSTLKWSRASNRILVKALMDHFRIFWQKNHSLSLTRTLLLFVIVTKVLYIIEWWNFLTYVSYIILRDREELIYS